ncbi:hypothetical protein E2562_002473 [Oryza meyeriana var. granulata]|uniref:Uncharacterized protein n=1 Tax=Oryza meyeriana var. granulata TaxID=110450 RepID=A0A6G1F2L6_9ORYZ|nr:hypothetical protein E2562_002473 [Oryza meyeriana var. granulata]KAF0931114.1 hypothetical protein E2562_002473 [Oryza meyeriana var. granulata]
MELGARPAALGCAPGLHCLLPRHPGPACATPPLDLARLPYVASDPVRAPRSHACRVSRHIAPTSPWQPRLLPLQNRLLGHDSTSPCPQIALPSSPLSFSPLARNCAVVTPLPASAAALLPPWPALLLFPQLRRRRAVACLCWSSPAPLCCSSPRPPQPVAVGGRRRRRCRAVVAVVAPWTAVAVACSPTAGLCVINLVVVLCASRRRLPSLVCHLRRRSSPSARAATSTRVIVAILTAASACSSPAHCAAALLCFHVAAAARQSPPSSPCD